MARTPLVAVVALVAASTASAGAAVPAPRAAASAAEAVAAARAWREAHAAEMLADFARLLALPNVASDREGIRANARAIAGELERRGFAVEVAPPPGEPEAPPVVFGELPADAPGGAERTVVLYAHYDGQPVEAERWTNPPWQPALYTRAIEAGGERRPLPGPGEPVDPAWRLYARSAGDDKAPIQALLAALDALAAAGLGRRVDVKVLLDGEEEAGSPHLAAQVERLGGRLAADGWLFLDGPVHQSGRPQLFFGVRGIAGLDLTVYGANRHLHSGHYGNWAPNPILELARLLAGMKGEDGRVRVAGFYDTVAPLGEAERRALAAIERELPGFDDELRRELGLAASEAGDAPYAERIALPSLNVRGFVGASVGDTARNVIPPSATASLDVRLVAGNDPEAMLDRIEEHVRAQGYHLVRDEPTAAERLGHPKLVHAVRRPGYRAVRTPMEGPFAVWAAAAAEAAAGALVESGGSAAVLRLPTLGGSLPLHVIADRLAAPIVGVPIANHDDNQHAPDENLRLANLFYGVDLLAALLAAPAPR